MLKLGIVIYISVKQIRSHARSLGPHTWVKLTLFGIYISVKQISSHVRSLELHTWAKLTLFGIYISVKDPKSCQVSRTTYLGKINIPWNLYKC